MSRLRERTYKIDLRLINTRVIIDEQLILENARKRENTSALNNPPKPTKEIKFEQNKKLISGELFRRRVLSRLPKCVHIYKQFKFTFVYCLRCPGCVSVSGSDFYPSSDSYQNSSMQETHPINFNGMSPKQL